MSPTTTNEVTTVSSSSTEAMLSEKGVSDLSGGLPRADRDSVLGRRSTAPAAERTNRELCEALRELAKRSNGKSFEQIQSEIDSLLATFMQSSKVQTSASRIDAIQPGGFKAYLKELFDSAYEQAHGTTPPDGLTFLQRCQKWGSKAVDVVIAPYKLYARYQEICWKGVVSVFDWWGNPNNRAKAWEMVKAAGNGVKDFVKNTATAAYDWAKDPKNWIELGRKALTGELLLDIGKFAVNSLYKVGKFLVVDFLWHGLIEGSGLWDCLKGAGKGIFACGLWLVGNRDAAGRMFAEAGQDFQRAGSNFCDWCGLKEFYEFGMKIGEALESGDPQKMLECGGLLLKGTFKMVGAVTTVIGVGNAIKGVTAAVRTFQVARVMPQAMKIEGEILGSQAFEVMSGTAPGQLSREVLLDTGKKIATASAPEAKAAVVAEMGLSKGPLMYELADGTRIMARVTPNSTQVANFCAKTETIVAAKTEEFLAPVLDKAAKASGYIDAPDVIHQVIKQDFTRLAATEVKDIAASIAKHPSAAGMTSKEVDLMAKGLKWLAEDKLLKKQSVAWLRQMKEPITEKLTERILAGGLKEGFDLQWSAEVRKMAKELGDEYGIILDDEAQLALRNAGSKGLKKGTRDLVAKIVDEGVERFVNERYGRRRQHNNSYQPTAFQYKKADAVPGAYLGKRKGPWDDVDLKYLEEKTDLGTMIKIDPKKETYKGYDWKIEAAKKERVAAEEKVKPDFFHENLLDNAKRLKVTEQDLKDAAINGGSKYSGALPKEELQRELAKSGANRTPENSPVRKELAGKRAA